MRNLFLIFQLLVFTGLRLAAQEEVTIDCRDQWGPGRYNKVSVSITFSHDGFARFTQDFPEGFTVIPDQPGGGDISWGANELNAVFMNVAKGKSLHFSYLIKPDAGMNGNFTIQGKLIVISESAVRFITILKERSVDIGGMNGLLPEEMTTDSPIKAVPVIARQSEPSDKNTVDRNVIFRVQVSASSSPVAEEKLRKELNLDQKISIIVVRAGRNFKYQAGEFADFDSASHLLKKLRDYGTKDAFVVAWFDGKQIEVEKARKMK